MNEGLKFRLSLSLIVVLFVVLVIAHAAKTHAGVNAAWQAAGDAKTIFEAKCAKCHGKDGHAKSFRGKLVHARNFTDAQWQNEVTDERLFNSISNGKGDMPVFKKKLSEDQINALVAYVRHFKK